MPSPTLTRRALIAGAGTAVASAALAVPYVSASHSEEVCSLPVEAEDITGRLDRLTNELALAMGEYLGGKFKVVVEPGPDGDVQFIRMDIPAQQRVEEHIAGLKLALSELEAGPVRAVVSSDTAALVEPMEGKPFLRGVPPVLWRIA